MDAGLHGGMETAVLDEDDWLFVWISAILLEAGSDRISLVKLMGKWNDGGKVWI